ncbi:protein-tyrosine phosphatase [Ceraceosorus guamensis]|uniref:Protein-tyrosine phosphatase n=1 Tax=Ceraceosorus guamensis TaxID=1522189 RepID=A0A316VUD2_9BASI|nr:protein-tyrosine phosphatase [Ceraceosorus guamensis]PWN40498.1 protein-tyrosine phosphatase [Ceraceosorus guamensis]
MASPASTEQPISVLMVCLGNICRSPMAEAVFKDAVHKHPSEQVRKAFGQIDSAGTGAYHAGDDADPRTQAELRSHGIRSTCRARKVTQADFQNFDWIFGMDTSNVRSLRASAPRNSRARIEIFGAFDDSRPIADPYYGGDDGFKECYLQCVRYSNAFLKHLGFPLAAEDPNSAL